MGSQLDLTPISDIYTVAFLLCTGERYHHIQRIVDKGRSKVVFHFSPEAADKIDDYFNGCECSAIGFRNAIENCKSLIYDFK